MLSIIFLSVVTLIFSLFLMQITVRVFNIKHLTIAGCFYIFYLARIWLPSFSVYANHPGPYRDIYMFAVQSVLITFPFGLLFVNVLLKYRTSEIGNYFSKPVIRGIANYHFKAIFIMLLMFSIIVIVLFIRSVEIVPVFYLIKHPGNYSAALAIRESLKLRSGVALLKYFETWVKFLILPFLSMVSLGLFWISKKKSEKRFWIAMFVLSMLIGIFFASTSIAKSPVASFFLILFIFFYLFKSGRIKKKFIAAFILLIFAYPLFILVMLNPDAGLGFTRLCSSTKSILIRVFYKPSDILYYYFEVFPAHVDYLCGRSIGKLALLMGKEYFNVPNYVGLYYHPTTLKTVNANAAFIGNLNADFGLSGVILGSFIVGAIVQMIQIYMLRQKKTVLHLAAYAFLIGAFFSLTATSATVVLLSRGVIVIFILLFGIKILEQILAGAIEKSN